MTSGNTRKPPLTGGQGPRGVVVSGIAALLIGAAPAIINFFYGAGQGM